MKKQAELANPGSPKTAVKMEKDNKQDILCPVLLCQSLTDE